MIVVCDPNCRGMSHETFNQGLLYGISLAYPNEKIVFFSSVSHGLTVQENLKNKNIKLDNVQFKSIYLYTHQDFLNPIWNRLLMKYVISFAKKNDARSVYFFSSSLVQEIYIKSMAGDYPNINFSINMHGSWDKIAFPDFQITTYTPKSENTFIQKLSNHKKDLMFVVFKRIINMVSDFIDKVLLMTMPRLNIKEVIYYNNFDNVKYVALSDFIVEELAKYIDLKKVNVCSIPLPAIFRDIHPMPINNKLKIAVFGYGHSSMLYYLNCALKNRKILKDYEIRIIGMDGRYIEGFFHVTHPINRVLTRDEMEHLQEDIDMFLILYEKERYCLSCSGSVIEAYNYIKPVLYLENVSVDAYNPKDSPVGISCKNIEDMSRKLENIINEYDVFKKNLSDFRENMINTRREIDIKSNLDRVKAIIGI